MEEQAIEAEEPRKEVRESRGFSRRRLWWGIVAVAVVALGISGIWLWASGTWTGWRTVARVDGERIRRADLEDHLAFLVRQGRIRQESLADPVREKEAERVALDDLVTRRLLLAEAERLKITVGPGEEDVVFGKVHGAQPGEPRLAEAAKKAGEDTNRMRQEVRNQLLITRLRDKITEDVSVSDEDIAKYYESHRQAFVAPELARLRLLILDSRQEAERLHQQHLKGADFAALARERSKGGTRESGGDMGWVDPRMLPPAIASAVAAIPQKGITPVIETKGGFYVVRVEGRQAPRQIPFSEVKGQITQALTAERKQAKFTEWIQERRRTARIQIYL